MSQVSLRSIQDSVIAKVIAAIESGKTDIFIQAPTGTGKGIIGLELAKMFSSYLLTSEKSLQQQYEDDTIRFDDYTRTKSICGVDTYQCHVNNEKFSLGVCRSMGLANAQAMRLPCAATCEYLQRWKKAKEAEQTIMNYSYYLVQMNYVLMNMEENAPFARRHLVVCDEAHKLPDIIESHFASTVDKKVCEHIMRTVVMLSSSRLFPRDLRCGNIVEAIDACLKIPLKADLLLHLEGLRTVKFEYEQMLIRLNALKDEVAEQFLSKKNGSVADLKKTSRNLPREGKAILKLLDNIKERHCKIADYIENIENHGLDNLIVDGETTASRTYHNLSDENLFKKHFATFSDVRVYMSATLQPDLLIKRWGIDPDNACVLDVKSDWDVNKSLVILCDAGDMSYRNAEAGMKSAVQELAVILDRHKNERGIIHTTSNAITEEICSRPRFASRLVRYTSTKEKMSILAAWDSYPADAIIIGPSLTTGIDLKDDLARFNVIVKLSFPNMKSALWAKRCDCLPHIYIGETASVLEQACGRTTRSKGDSSVSYILDSRAEKFIENHFRYFSPQFLNRVRRKQDI